MKFRLLLLSLLISAKAITAQTVYPVVISFHSECCGVPSDSSLRKFINAFKKQYKIKHIKAEQIGPMGREGEFYLAFNLKELTTKQKRSFISKAKKLKKLPGDNGSLRINLQMKIDPETLPGRATNTAVSF